MNNVKKLFRDIYSRAISLDKKQIQKLYLNNDFKNNILVIAENSQAQKAVFTVIITLAVYKILNPSQDIRCHQKTIVLNGKTGFSGRSFDTEYITPMLTELGLPHMAESGWLTRSLEQPYPYTLDYQGKISNKNVKASFLYLIDVIENNNKSKDVLDLLFFEANKILKSNSIEIEAVKFNNNITIDKLIHVLEKYFFCKYNTHNGAKLPVIAFYSIFEILIIEMDRYKNCYLDKIGSHTASDKTSKKSGDIEIFNKEDLLFESFEIKLDREITYQLYLQVEEKVKNFLPKRYYLLSTKSYKNDEEKIKITSALDLFHSKNQSQIIINGLIPTLKYYFRLVSDLELFINKYSYNIQNDKELQQIHKEKWIEIIEELKQ